MNSPWSLALLVLVSVSAFACGDSGGGGDSVVLPSGDGDGDDRPDGSIPGDGDGDGDGDSSYTGTPPEGIVGGCGIDENRIFELTRTTDNPQSSPIGIDRFNSRAAIVYVDPAGDCSESVHLATVEGDANSLDPPEPTVAVAECNLYADPAVVWAAEEAWLLAFIDNRNGNEVRTQVHDPNGALSNDGFQISDGANRPSTVAIGVAATDRRMVAWTEGGTTIKTIMARPVDLTGEPVGPAQVVATVEGSVHSLTLSQLGKADDSLPPSGVLIGYHRLTASASEIVVQALDLDGVPKSGEPRVVRSDVGNRAQVASIFNHTHQIGVDLSAGAITYAVEQFGGQQLWFETLDNDAELGQLWDGTGRPRGPSSPIRIVEAPQRATHPSVARIPQGYMVAYRALPGGDVDRARIRVIFLDRNGQFTISSDVAYTTDNGGPVRVLQGSDGRSVIVWSELDADTEELVYKAARMPCP